MIRIFLALILALLPVIAQAQDALGGGALGPVAGPTLPIGQENGGTSVNPASMQQWRAAMAGVQAGLAYTNVVYIGDSSVQSAENSTYGDTQENVTYWLSADLNAAGVPANQSGFCGFGGLPTRPSTDSRITLGQWESGSGAGQSLGGDMYFTTTTGSPFVFSPGVSWDTANLLYLNYPGSGSISIQATGGTAVSINQNGTAALASATATAAGASSSNTLSISFSSGSQAYFECVQTWSSTEKSVNIINAGITGGVMSYALGTSNPWSPQNVITALNPSLVIIEGGINDYSAGVSVSQFTAETQQLASSLIAQGRSVLLVTGNFAALSGNSAMIPYANAMRQIAVQDGLPIVSIDLRWRGSPAPGSTTPSMVGAADGEHPSAAGAADIARAVASALLN